MCMCGVWSIFANFAVAREVLYKLAVSVWGLWGLWARGAGGGALCG